MKTFQPNVIGITGAKGFLGWHFRCMLHARGFSNIKVADREELSTEEGYRQFVKDCDVIMHFAGMARGEPNVVAETNVDIGKKLVRALEGLSTPPHVVYVSSIQIYNNNPYGRSKAEVGHLLEDWAKKSGGKFSNVIMPNLFGECGKPFYNSVVATFCHQVVRNESPTIITDAEIPLLHAQDACDIMWSIVEKNEPTSIQPPGKTMKVSELASKLKYFHSCYAPTATIPELSDAWTRALFATYRSSLFEVQPTHVAKLHTDPRGSLSEIVKTKTGGQAFFSTTKPNITRGEHYHRRKLERFAVIGGEAVVRIRKLFSNEIHEFKLKGSEPVWVDMPTLHTHHIQNVGTGDLYTVFWADEIFDPSNPDTFPEKVEKK